MNFLKNILVSTNVKNHQRFLQEANKSVPSVTDIPNVVQKRNYSPDTPGSGAGKGGGAGGSIRESGGGLGQYGAAQEEGFFYNKSREELGKLKKQLQKEREKPTEISHKHDK